MDGIVVGYFEFCKGAFFPFFLPYIMDVIGGSTLEAGIFQAFLGLGLIMGTLSVGFIKVDSKHLRNVMLGSVIVDGICTVALGLSSYFALSLVFVALSAFCMPVMTVNNTTMYQQRVPEHMRGRVFAVRILLTTIGMPIGALFGGAVGEYWGIPVLYCVVGIIMILSASICFLLPSLKNYQDEKITMTPARGCLAKNHTDSITSHSVYSRKSN